MNAIFILQFTINVTLFQRVLKYSSTKTTFVSLPSPHFPILFNVDTPPTFFAIMAKLLNMEAPSLRFCELRKKFIYLCDIDRFIFL